VGNTLPISVKWMLAANFSNCWLQAAELLCPAALLLYASFASTLFKNDLASQADGGGIFRSS
ncbi:MAG: hypothetical protein AAGJ69_11965, partial [Cyanobacteria bacterium J06559_1]